MAPVTSHKNVKTSFVGLKNASRSVSVASKIKSLRRAVPAPNSAVETGEKRSTLRSNVLQPAIHLVKMKLIQDCGESQITSTDGDHHVKNELKSTKSSSKIFDGAEKEAKSSVIPPPKKMSWSGSKLSKSKLLKTIYGNVNKLSTLEGRDVVSSTISEPGTNLAKEKMDKDVHGEGESSTEKVDADVHGQEDGSTEKVDTDVYGQEVGKAGSDQSTGKSQKFKCQRISRSRRAGVTFPVGRLHRQLRNFTHTRLVQNTAPVFMAAVLEYLVSEVLDLAVEATQKMKKRRITPRALEFAVRCDDDFAKVWNKVTIPECGGGGLSKFVPAEKVPPKKKRSRK